MIRFKNLKNRNNSLLKESLTFILFGFLTVFIDFNFYLFFINLKLEIKFAKALSFIIGALFSYFTNKKWTFNAYGSYRVFIRFALTYITSLIINISTNSLILSINQSLFFLTFAFLTSTICSASFNFLALRLFVFNKRKK